MQYVLDSGNHSIKTGQNDYSHTITACISFLQKHHRLSFQAQRWSLSTLHGSYLLLDGGADCSRSGRDQEWEHAVCVQNVLQGHDADQLVYIGAVDYRQQIDLVAAHALQGQIQPLICMHVGKDRSFIKSSSSLLASSSTSISIWD